MTAHKLTTAKAIESPPNVPSAKKRPAKTRLEATKSTGQGKDIGEIPQKSGTVGYKRPPVDTQFKPGNLANPGGKPNGSRNRLQGDFMRALSEDFSEHGRAAIIACRIEKPDVYIKVVASLMPKELEIKRPLEDLTDDELDSAVALLRSFLDTPGDEPDVTVTPTRKQTH